MSAVKFPVHINGNESFYICTNEMILMLEEIYRKNLELTEKVGELSEIARMFCFKKCLIDEVNFTNDIEGIFSSRKELDEIYENIHSEAGTNKYAGLVDKYKLLLDSEKTIQLKTCEDVRQLYDEIILPEIASKDIPDGKLFRKGSVVVSNGIKDIHTGVAGEDNIIYGMNAVLSVMYDPTIPAVIRAAVCHYFIEYT